MGGGHSLSFGEGVGVSRIPKSLKVEEERLLAVVAVDLVVGAVAGLHLLGRRCLVEVLVAEVDVVSAEAIS